MKEIKEFSTIDCIIKPLEIAGYFLGNNNNFITIMIKINIIILILKSILSILYDSIIFIPLEKQKLSNLTEIPDIVDVQTYFKNVFSIAENLKKVLKN